MLVLHTACIGLGSNLGNSLDIVRSAWQGLDQPGSIEPMAISNPYRSEPVDMVSSNWFVNAAALVRTSLSPSDLLQRLFELEKMAGRVRREDSREYQDRALDLDLLLFDQLVIQSPRLSLPHPEMCRRLFVLAPLAEIAGEYLHPIRNQTIAALLQTVLASPSNPVVEKISWHS